MFMYILYLQNEGALGDLQITDVGVGGPWWMSVSVLLKGPQPEQKTRLLENALKNELRCPQAQNTKGWCLGPVIGIKQEGRSSYKYRHRQLYTPKRMAKAVPWVQDPQKRSLRRRFLGKSGSEAKLPRERGKHDWAEEKAKSCCE